MGQEMPALTQLPSAPGGSPTPSGLFGLLCLHQTLVCAVTQVLEDGSHQNLTGHHQPELRCL